jgi:hypothetical protein
VNPVLPADALEFGDAARKAFASLGGVDAARRAEADPSFRHEVGELLQALGVDDLDPRADADTAAAVAVLCEESGRVALPYPVAGVTLRSTAAGGDRGLPVAVVGRFDRVDHHDLFPRWRVDTIFGDTGTAEPLGPPLGTRLGPFVGSIDCGDWAPGAHDDTTAGWWLTLSAWTILGACRRAVELATAHTQDRIQFGKPLTAFQVVRFQLADAAVAVAGLRELALFTLWRLDVAPDQARPDVLALRSHALDVARAVFRSTQQLHGASGLCDELDISILVRHLQPALRLPAGAEETAGDLAAAIAEGGFDGLFPHGRAG